LGTSANALAKIPFAHYSFVKTQGAVASLSSFQDQDSCYNEPILVERIKYQVWGHKHEASYGMQSCVPFEHSPWLYYSKKPTFLGHKE
jgi:hypothetical protein